MLVRVTRHTTGLFVAVGVVLLVTSSSWIEAARAQTVNDESRQVVEVPIYELTEIQEELRYLRKRDSERQAWETSVTKRLPAMNFPLVSEGNWFSEDSILEDSCSDQDPAACCTTDPCCDCSCYPCQCPLPEAPCIDCPRVSTLNPNFNVHIFGALVGDMLFNEARPVSPGAPYYLSPASPSGLDQNTVDVHGRSSTLAAAFTGPMMGNFQAGGMAMAFFYNDSVLADQYGILPAQVWGDLRNEYWRFAAGLQFDVFNPTPVI
jgi:hypothetical protein